MTYFSSGGGGSRFGGVCVWRGVGVQAQLKEKKSSDNEVFFGLNLF